MIDADAEAAALREAVAPRHRRFVAYRHFAAVLGFKERTPHPECVTTFVRATFPDPK